jgi:hypothetical protein
MTIKAAKFTPEVMLAAPRRGHGVPNSDGSRVLFSVNSYSFADHRNYGEIRQLRTETNESNLVTDVETAGEPHWIDYEYALLLVAGKDGTSHIVIGDPDDFSGS